MSSIAHPLIVPIAAPGMVARAARSIVVRALAAAWPTGGERLELILPGDRALTIGAAEAATPIGSVTRGGARGDTAIARIHDDRLFVRMLARGELGAGEAYVAGEWDSDDLVAVIRRFLRATGARGFESPLTALGRLPAWLRHRRAANSRTGSERNIHAHYDLGNDFYRLFLDDTLAYSCALWTGGARTLGDAQRAKLDRIAELLALAPGMHVLEIGAGWGGLAIHLARTRGVRVTAVTVSRAQLAEARARVAAAGVADRVAIEYADYRDVRGTYDRVVSCEMLEAVGHDYLPTYFAQVGQLLAPGGRAVVQTITMPDDRYDDYRRSVDWMQTYIFPGSCIPSLAAILAALPGSGLTLTRADDIGPHYAPTVRAWRDAFETNLAAVRALGFDEPFVRTWRLYLAFSEAAFAERTLGDHQLVLVKA
jgi:cyclopropane-fatty-acyl-phospholipid synthase